MSEIQTVAVITATPGNGDKLEGGLRSLAAATHDEAGCILYGVVRGLADRDVFVTVERWASQEDLDAHLASPHLAEAIGALGDIFAAPPQIIPGELLDLDGSPKGSY